MMTTGRMSKIRTSQTPHENHRRQVPRALFTPSRAEDTEPYSPTGWIIPRRR